MYVLTLNALVATIVTIATPVHTASRDHSLLHYRHPDVDKSVQINHHWSEFVAYRQYIL